MALLLHLASTIITDEPSWHPGGQMATLPQVLWEWLYKPLKFRSP